MDDKVVKIPLSIFKNRYNIDVPEHILQKAETLKKSCSCFESFYDPKMIWEKKLYNKRDKQHSQHSQHQSQYSHQPQYQQHHQPQYQQQQQHSHNNQYNAGTTHVAPVAATASNKGRFHIIIPDFSDNSSTKRALIGHLNKLTTKNRDVIYEKIKAIIDANNTEELFSIICSYIKVSDSAETGNLYITLLDYFDSTFLNDLINKLWNNYITQKEWIPPKYVFDNNLLLLNNEYELYCDYVKWKKGIHNTNIIWAKYKQHEIPRLLNDIYDYLVEECIGNPQIHKYIIDIFFEQILKILRLKELKECKELKESFDKSIVVEKIKSLDIKSFDSSTKFLIYAIIENK
jgi:hypothetical protein